MTDVISSADSDDSAAGGQESSDSSIVLTRRREKPHKTPDKKRHSRSHDKGTSSRKRTRDDSCSPDRSRMNFT
jgi:hypothetical protein